MSIAILYVAASLAILVFAVRFDLWRRRRKSDRRRARYGGNITEDLGLALLYDDQADPREWLR